MTHQIKISNLSGTDINIDIHRSLKLKSISIKIDKDSIKLNVPFFLSNKKIDTLYNQAMKHGALGGKLLGAGGGGFLLMYMKNTAKKKFFKKFKNTINVPFGFSSAGSQIIFNSLKE